MNSLFESVDNLFNSNKDVLFNPQALDESKISRAKALREGINKRKQQTLKEDEPKVENIISDKKVVNEVEIEDDPVEEFSRELFKDDLDNLCKYTDSIIKSCIDKIHGTEYADSDFHAVAYMLGDFVNWIIDTTGGALYGVKTDELPLPLDQVFDEEDNLKEQESFRLGDIVKLIKKNSDSYPAVKVGMYGTVISGNEVRFTDDEGWGIVYPFENEELEIVEKFPGSNKDFQKVFSSINDFPTDFGLTTYKGFKDYLLANGSLHVSKDSPEILDVLSFLDESTDFVEDKKDETIEENVKTHLGSKMIRESALVNRTRSSNKISKNKSLKESSNNILRRADKSASKKSL